MPPKKPITQAQKLALKKKQDAARLAAERAQIKKETLAKRSQIDFSSLKRGSDPNLANDPKLDSYPIKTSRPEFGYAYGKMLRPREARNFAGLPSLFNNYAVFRYYPVAGSPSAALDIRGNGGGSVTTKISRNPDAASIIEHAHNVQRSANGLGAMPYAWADFLYCTYYGKIPNNYMITLRRYATPTMDNLQTQDGKPMYPISQAVTWMSEKTENKLSEIMKFTAGLNWKEIEAGVQEVIGNERGAEAGPFRGNDGNDAAVAINAFFNPNDFSGLTQSQEDYSREAWGADGPYANKVYGPVNVISKSLARDRGMDYKHDISLNFHYSAMSLGDINPRMAMLDILGNLLSLTYNNAKFWGGAIRYFPQHPNYAFMGDQKKFYNGDMGGFIDSYITSLGLIGNKVLEQLSNLMNNPIETLKKLAIGGGTMFLGNKAAQSRPQILAIRSLLTGNPVGEWHMCVGNPLNPFAMVGNLICEGIDVEFGDEFGADDFPTELKATIRLKHGKPRDKGDIESMFNYGNGRLYYGEFFDKDRQEELRASANESNATKANPGNSKKDKDNRTSNQVAMNVRSVRNNGMWGAQFTKGAGDSTYGAAEFFD